MQTAKCSMTRIKTTSVLALLALLSNDAIASTIAFQNSVKETIKAASHKNHQWFNYKVAMEPNNGMPCCLIKQTESSCHLEKRSNSWSSAASVSKSSKELTLTFKVKNDKLSDLFLAGSECKIETGKSMLTSISDVSNIDSLAFLNEQLKKASQNSHIEHTILAAIALHSGTSSHAFLERLAKSEERSIRRKSIFWLGEARNKAGYDSLLSIIEDNSRDEKTRAQAVLALSENSHSASVKKLVQLAKHSDNEHIQIEAIFWLAQNHSGLANEAIKEVLQNSDRRPVRKKAVFSLAQIDNQQSWQQLVSLAQSEGDRDVQEEAIFWLSQTDTNNPVSVLTALVNGNSPLSIKKRAVFALAQLKPSQSLATLSDLAENATQESIKKEAIFWLGQSSDPNALNYIERLLTE